MRKIITRNKYADKVSTKVDVTGLKNRMLVSAMADVIFVAFRSSHSNVFFCDSEP